MVYHPVANLFPLMQGEEFERIRDDIAANGLREPIWLHSDGSIIDGRNRYRACVDLGISPQFRVWDGEGSLISFVVSLNLHRRHLTTGQRAMIAVDLLPMLEEEARARQGQRNDLVARMPQGGAGKSRDHAAAITQTGSRYVSEAKRIQQVAPDLAAEIREGKKNLPWARRVLAERQSRNRAQERAQDAPKPAGQSVRLIVGDAAALDLPDESVDVIITSPPYNLGGESWPMGGHERIERQGIGYADDLNDEAYQEWQLCVLEELFRVAKPGASLFYNHKTRTRDGRLQHPMRWLGRAEGWTLRQEIIWDREVTHNHSATLFWPVDERIYWLTKGKPTLAGPIGMATVWRFHGPQPYTWHPAPFSEELPRRCLQAIGGDRLTVLDPFAGSCTTVKVAAEMGHEAIGVDFDTGYLDRARVEYGW